MIDIKDVSLYLLIKKYHEGKFGIQYYIRKKSITFCIMGQQVLWIRASFIYNFIIRKRYYLIKFLHKDPKLNELTYIYMDKIIVWTYVCSNILGWSKVRGEMPIEFSDSWFFTKTLLGVGWEIKISFYRDK